MKPNEMDEVKKRVKKMRSSGRLSQAVRSTAVNYGIDDQGRPYALYPDGRLETGIFRDGKFIADKNSN